MIALYQPLSGMMLCFVQAILLGAGLGLWYDALHAWPQRGRRHSGVCDALFWLAALTAYFVFTVTLAGGQVRGYVLLGLLLGGICGHILLGGMVRALVRTVQAGLCLAVRLCVRPVRIFGQRMASLCGLIQKNLEKIAKRASISGRKKI